MNERDSGLSESLEDYLEVILILETANKVARVRDIASQLNIKSGSVTGALKNLEQKGMINYKPYSYITLTEEGARVAKEIRRRHSVLKDFFLRLLQLDLEKADMLACRMEHVLDPQSISRLVNFIEFIDQCPRTGQDWIASFRDYCASKNREPDNCRACMKKCLKKEIPDVVSTNPG